MRLIRAFSRRGILVGTVETALLPALYAATWPDAEGGRLYAPSGFGNLAGAPAEQSFYRPLRGTTFIGRHRGRAAPGRAPRVASSGPAGRTNGIGTRSPRDGEPSGPGWGVLPTSPGGVHF